MPEGQVGFMDRAQTFSEGLERIVVPLANTVSNTAAIFNKKKKVESSDVEQANKVSSPNYVPWIIGGVVAIVAVALIVKRS